MIEDIAKQLLQLQIEKPRLSGTVERTVRNRQKTEPKLAKKKWTFRKPRFPDPLPDWSNYQIESHADWKRKFEMLCSWCLHLPGWYPMIETDDCRRRVSALYIRHREGGRVSFRFGWSAGPGRVSFYCYGVNRDCWDSITISQKRNPAAAAADLTRRLLVDYLASYALERAKPETEIGWDVLRYRTMEKRVKNLKRRYLAEHRISNCDAGLSMRHGNFDLTLYGLSAAGLERVWQVARAELIADHAARCLASKYWRNKQADD